jgi:prevent-host-death family protein
MKIAPLAEVKAKFSEYVNACHNGAVVVTRNGKPAAALIAINNDDELEKIILSQSKRFQSILNHSEQNIKNKGGIRHADFWEKAAKTIGN